MRTKFIAISSCAQVLALIVLSSFLSACSRDNRAADIKQCIAKGETSQKGWDRFQTADSAEERHDQIGGLIADCIRKARYTQANNDV
jgi:hypothetical protein